MASDPAAPKPDGLRERVAVLWAGAAALAVMAPTLLYPYARDQSVFAYVGAVIARGGMPYRDAWDLKPPGIYLLYALLARVSPPGFGMMAAVRIADVAVTLVTCGLLALLTHRLAVAARGRGAVIAGAAAGAWYAVLYFHGTFWGMAQAESWANPLVVGAMLAALRAQQEPGHRRAWIALAGALCGGAAVLKFTSVLPALPLVALALASTAGDSRRHAAARVGPDFAAFVAAGAAPLVAAAVWLWAGHALGAYVDVDRGFLAPYTHLNAPGLVRRVANVFGYTLGWLRDLWPATLLAAAGALFLRRAAAIPAAVLLCGLAAVWAQNKYFGYHWQTALPGFCILAGLGTAWLVEAGSGQRSAISSEQTADSRQQTADGGQRPAASGRWPILAGLAPALLAAALWDGAVYRDAALRVAGRLPKERWLARWFGEPYGGDFSFLADTWAARYVRDHTRREDPILVWGFEPAVYLLSGRRCPTRFFFNVPVAVRFTPERWRREFLNDLAARPPELVLVLHHDPIPWANGRPDDSAAQLRDWPELRRWLAARYRFEGQIEDFSVYRRTPAEFTTRFARGTEAQRRPGASEAGRGDAHRERGCSLSRT